MNPACQIKVGTYRLGHENITLYAAKENSGGDFCVCSDDGVGFISIGIKDRWGDVLSVLLHEMLEYAFARLDVRYVKPNRWADNAAACTFHFDHQEFSEAVAIVGNCLSECAPAIRDVYMKHTKSDKGEPVAKKRKGKKNP